MSRRTWTSINIFGKVVEAAKKSLASKEQVAKRLEVCEQCAPKTLTCPECSCIKSAKVRLSFSKCPLKKW